LEFLFLKSEPSLILLLSRKIYDAPEPKIRATHLDFQCSLKCSCLCTTSKDSYSLKLGNNTFSKHDSDARNAWSILGDIGVNLQILFLCSVSVGLVSSFQTSDWA
jgi:hypothetical protein